MSKLRKVLFMGGQQAGNLGLATLRALDVNPDVVAYGHLNSAIGLNAFASIKDIQNWDFELLISIHGREIVPYFILRELEYGGINLHPCLSKYPGADPIGRYLADKGTIATIGAHYMTKEVDKGPVIYELSVDAVGCSTREEVYQKLYPYYPITLLAALKRLDLI